MWCVLCRGGGMGRGMMWCGGVWSDGVVLVVFLQSTIRSVITIAIVYNECIDVRYLTTLIGFTITLFPALLLDEKCVKLCLQPL